MRAAPEAATASPERSRTSAFRTSSARWEKGVDATRCGGTGDCQDGEICLTHELWADLSQQIDLFLKRITFAALVERRDIRRIARRQDPKNLISAQML